jgi:hypothetical protein
MHKYHERLLHVHFLWQSQISKENNVLKRILKLEVYGMINETI